MTGTVALTPLIANDHVTNRTVVITINGTVQPPIDATTNPAQFQCADQDAVSGVVTDSNAGGSTVGDPFTITASLPVQPPTKPGITGITFSP